MIDDGRREEILRVLTGHCDGEGNITLPQRCWSKEIGLPLKELFEIFEGFGDVRNNVKNFFYETKRSK